MRVIPVLDLLDGVVVRGVAGKRGDYRPVESRIVASAEPMAVARAFRDLFGLTELYVADLDAILHRRPNRRLYQSLTDEGFRLLVDCGVREASDASAALEAGAAAVVAGLETLPGPDLLRALCASHGGDRIVFSLDLMGGSALGQTSAWSSAEPGEIAEEAIGCGTRRLIVLDLERVGVGAGLSTLALCGELRDRNPQLELITGGGVRGPSDLRELAAARVDGVLIASALHDGRLTRGDIDAVTS